MRKAQSLLEYSFIFTIVLAALFGMNAYLRRGIQTVIKVASDEMGNQTEFENRSPDWTTRIKTPMTVTASTRGADGNVDSDADGITDLEQGVTQRLRIFEGGSQRVDFQSNTATYGSPAQEQESVMH